MKTIMLLSIFVFIGFSAEGQLWKKVGNKVKQEVSTQEKQEETKPITNQKPQATNPTKSKPSPVQKLAEAKALLEEDPTSHKAQNILQDLLHDNPTDEEINYLLAYSILEGSGANHRVEEYITAAIKANPTNSEYRWMRFRCNMLMSSDKEDFQQAIKDVTQIINSGESSGKLYASLGMAEGQLANHIHRFDKAEKNTGFSDDNSEYINKQTAYYQDAIHHYEQAKMAYREAIKIDPDRAEKLNYSIKDADREISTIKKQIAKLN